jgi:hypothetical protein
MLLSWFSPNQQKASRAASDIIAADVEGPEPPPREIAFSVPDAKSQEL